MLLFITNIGDMMNYGVLILKTIFFYFFIVFVYRIMGKREVGQLGIIDLIVSVLIAELVAISLGDEKISIFVAVIPVFILVICQIVMSFLSLKNKKIRKLLDGKPSLIINKGRIMLKEMLKQRYNLDDLLTQLRDKDYDNTEDIEYAILETSGKLSVFDKESDSFPLPLIIDGEVDYDSLKLINKSKEWLLNKLDCDLKMVFYAFYKNKSLYLIKKDELLDK